MSDMAQVAARADGAVADLVDRLVALARSELGPGITVERDADDIVISGPGLALRRIADVRMRDLIGTAIHQGGDAQ